MKYLMALLFMISLVSAEFKLLKFVQNLYKCPGPGTCFDMYLYIGPFHFNNIGTPLLRGLEILWGGGGFYLKIS
jgi:hypothetical protein